jgi:hypothetical protein
VPRIDAVEQPKALYTDNSCSKPVWGWKGRRGRRSKSNESKIYQTGYKEISLIVM